MSKIVVIGGSAGAIKALKTILPMLPQDFPAAILIVTHIGSQRSIVPEILARCTSMPVRHATDGEPIIPGRILVAPPNEHLTVTTRGDRAYASLVHGPKENHCRPAIDPLFRSAASAFKARTIGVLLSGYLDDGTVGLQAVKACGGTVIVQDPVEAEALDMPASALEHVDVDRVLPVSEIAAALVDLATRGEQQTGLQHGEAASPVPAWVDIENRITCQDSDMDALERIGKQTALTCPDCNGALWEISHKGLIRYRCHTGHAFTARVLEALQGDAVEDAIWGAVRALHEQERLFMKLADKERDAGRAEEAADYGAKAAQARAHSRSLREVIGKRGLIIKNETS